MQTIKKILLSSLLLALAACNTLSSNETVSTAKPLSQQATLNIVMACERTEHGYAMYRDRHDAQSFANLFTEDGEWGRSNGRIIKGREAIEKYITESASNQEVPEYHMQSTTTVQITPSDASNATGISYALLLEAPVPEDGGRARIESGFQVASESRSVYKIGVDGCKIAQREYTTFFTAP